MLALAKTKTGKGLTLMEFGEPTPNRDEILIKVAAAGICGSDVHIYQWASGYEWMEDVMPLIPGHEVAGVVAAKGSAVVGFDVGDRVVSMPGAGCGKCDLCREGLIAVYAAKKQIGLHRNGAFAEYVTVSASACIKLPDDIDLKVAVLAEPLAVSLRVVERAGSLAGKKVAVMGAGMIGLGVAHFASGAKARTWIFGKEQDEAKFKISKCLGVEGSVNVDRDSLTGAWEKITNKEGFDVVFDCTGVSALIQECRRRNQIYGRRQTGSCLCRHAIPA